MRVAYFSRELERICTEERYMKRKLSVSVAKALRLRIKELHHVERMSDLLAGVGRWEELAGDRSGQWSARLTANWRLIVEPDDTNSVKVTVVEESDETTVTVIKIVDYHKR